MKVQRVQCAKRDAILSYNLKESGYNTEEYVEESGTKSRH